MRLDSLWISHFKNLHDLTVTWDSGAPISVLVGRNGTGKSNLLEALVMIFRDLDLQANRPRLTYRLAYVRGGRKVAVDADPSRDRNKISITVDGARLSLRDFSEQREELLPGFVFGYYSGPGDRFEEHFADHQNRYYEALLADDDVPLRRLFFARPFHSQFVLLAFFVDPDEALQAFVSEFLGIEGIESISLVLRQPRWADAKSDDEFWDAIGTPRPLMERLYAASVAPVRDSRQVKLDFRRSQTREHIWLHLDGIDRLRDVYEMYETRQEFFKALESLVISDLLGELSVVVRIRGIDGGLQYRELSEGEQQLLTVLGLLRFTQEEHSLMLLDEPDTHLNPAWSIEYVRLLESVMGALPSSQVLLATHDPLVVAGLTREQVVLLERSDAREVTARHPERHPRGMGVAGLLTSEVYGLRSQLDLDTLELLDEKRALAGKAKRSAADRRRLAELQDVTDEVDLAATVRDPLYRVFIEAMQRVEHEEALDSPVLSADERRRRRQLAVEVLEELRSRSGVED